MSASRTAQPPRGRLWLRVVRWALAGLLIVVLIVTVLAVPLTVLPESVAVPSEPDVVVVLAGGDGERLGTGLALMERQVGPPTDLLLLSQPDSTDEEIAALCGETQPEYAIACFTPDSETTAGEAQAIGELAEAERWERIALVTSTYHATRARRRVERCVEAEVQVVAASPDLSAPARVRASLQELVALVRDALDDGSC